MLQRLFGTEARVFEWVCVLGNVAWGAWLLNPDIDWSRPAYEVFTALLPPFAWAVIIIALGLLHGLALFRSSRTGREWLSLLQAAVWLYIAFALGLHNLHSTAFVSYSWLAGIHAVTWLRLAVISR